MAGATGGSIGAGALLVRFPGLGLGGSIAYRAVLGLAWSEGGASCLEKDLTWPAQPDIPISTGPRKFGWVDQRMGCGCGVSFRVLAMLS
jgi:hypothetical protein